MMPWDANLTNLKYVLADLYYEKDRSVDVVRDAGLPVAQIPFKDRATNNWANILDEADKRGKVANIIQAALRDFPDNQFLLSAQKGTLTPVHPILDDNLSWKSPEPTETLEKLMGKQSTFLPISWLEAGQRCAQSVARVKLANKYATGFLICNNVFVTNHHVLDTKEKARSAIIQFNYQQDIAGLDCEPVEFQLDPDAVFKTSAENDWTVVRVKGDANADWGALDLQPVDIRMNDRANIIQHPGGGAKQIAFYHNIIAYVDDTRIQYLTDTLAGSSGSPVFDSQWQLIAIHHSGGSIIEPGTKKPVYRNEGINILCLLKDVERLG